MRRPGVIDAAEPSLTAFGQIVAACDRYEASWLAGLRPRVEDFLDDAPAAERSDLLRELLALELEWRRRSGEQPTSAEYLARFPDDPATIDAAFDAAPTGDGGSSGDPQAHPAPPALPVQVPGFEILGELGRGGMAVVYRAWQAGLGREVALKVLPPALAHHGTRLSRFRNEARIAARLTHAHILPIFDILECGGALVLVMPLIEWDLARLLDQEAARDLRPGCGSTGPGSDRPSVLPLLDQLIGAVAALHAVGVLHRDIKPSNVLVDADGTIRLSDFGLARLLRETGITATGAALGTPGYMAPEQWEGRRDLDERCDVFGLGACLYRAIVGELPYGPGPITRATPPARVPAPRQGESGGQLIEVAVRALAPDPARRYTSAVELLDDWKRARSGLLAPSQGAARLRGPLLRIPRSRPGRLACLLAIAGLTAGFSLHARYRPADARRLEAAPPGDPVRRVNVATEPPGARAVLVPIDPSDGRPMPGRAIHLRPGVSTPAPLHVAPGDYLVEVALGDGRHHEVRRHVPLPGELVGAYRHQRSSTSADGTVNLPEIESPAASVADEMAYFAGDERFIAGTDRIAWVPPHPRPVAPFYLDPTEVTVREYGEAIKSLPRELRGSPPYGSSAVTYVSFDQAVHCAELLGKRLPTEWEYEFAATAGGARIFPWGDGPAPRGDDWRFGPVGEPNPDRTPTSPPVFGLFSNVAEWTSSWPLPYPGGPAFTPPDYRSARVVRGGPASVAEGVPAGPGLAFGPRWRTSYTRDQIRPGLGFRCACSARPHYLAAGRPR